MSPIDHSFVLEKSPITFTEEGQGEEKYPSRGSKVCAETVAKRNRSWERRMNILNVARDETGARTVDRGRMHEAVVKYVAHAKTTKTV